MKPLDYLLPYVLTRAHKCPEPTALDALRRAAQEFCQRTKLWRDQDRFEVSGDNCEVVCVPYGAVLHEIESSRFDRRLLEPVSISWLDHNIHDWRNKEASGARYITQIAPDTVRLVPGAAGTLDISTVLKPSDDTDQLPRFMVDSYSRVLSDGALAELLTIPGQTFFNPDLAGFFSARFEREMNRLSSMSIRGQQRAPARTVAQFF